MARLFVAAWPPHELLEDLERLERADEPGLRWTTRDQWHVTLRFLGPADPDRVMDVLSELTARYTEAMVGPRVSRLGRHVAVVPVAGLDELAASVRRATEHLGEPPDPRPFAGHITLARLPRSGRCGLVGARVEGHFAVKEIVLVGSETHPDGARYTDLARFPLERP